MIPPELAGRYRELRSLCAHWLPGHPPLSMVEQLDAIRGLASAYPEQDYYGEGELMATFEQEIAQLLGKEAAVFLPSGTMAQCIALRIWSDLADCRAVGFHATSHLELHEQRAYEALYGLEGVLLGEPARVLSLADLASAGQELAAVLLELPMREIGGQLPAWEELEAQSDWARERGVALHMDGARLWQCAPYYRRSMAEIAGLFDSVYLSFYKDMGGIAGSVLAGPGDFIELARTWIRRAGGNLYALYPYLLAARAGMDRNLPAMAAAVEDAGWLAATLNTLDGLETLPREPPTNLFHLRVPLAPVPLVEYALEWSGRHRVFLLPMPRAGDRAHSVLEFSLGRAVRQCDRQQWQHWLQDFFGGLPAPP